MDKDIWNKKILENKGDFLQSYEWGDFQLSLGRRIERISADGFLTQVIFHPLPFGLNYGYIPHGPVILSNKIQDTSNKNLFWRELEKIRDPSTVFWQFDLLRPTDLFSPVSPESRQPHLTSVLDLTPDTDVIFSGFHKNHRYSIRKAEERDVEVRQEKKWENFFDILSHTARQQKFRIWPKTYYQKLLKSGMAEIWSAYHKGALVASHLYILFGSRVTHLFGGSDRKKRELMAPHLLHWRVVQEYKERRFGEYDFWGTDREKWPGLTLFKERFGGRRTEYPGSYTRALRPVWYKAYKLARRAR